MPRKSMLAVIIPILLLLALSPVVFSSGISDLSKGVVIGLFLGLALLALLKGKRKAR